MDKEGVYIHTMEHYSAIRMNKIMPFSTTWMNLEIIILSTSSQTEKDKYHIILVICGIKKKMIQMNLFTKRKKLTDIGNNLRHTKGGKELGKDKLGLCGKQIHTTIHKHQRPTV